MKNSGLKIGLEKFDGKKSFTMWMVRMEDLLIQLRLDSTLKDRLEEITDKKWVSIEKRACAMIRACLVDEVLYDVLEKRTHKGL